jgi:hypothetical protein
MTIPKEIVEKMEQVNSLMTEIDKWLDENIDTDGSRHNHRKFISGEYCHNDHYEFDDEPSGEPQMDGEYCNQSTAISGDSFYGTYYYPTEKGNYFCFEYWL